jgi:hypothetical protein
MTVASAGSRSIRAHGGDVSVAKDHGLIVLRRRARAVNHANVGDCHHRRIDFDELLNGPAHWGRCAMAIPPATSRHRATRTERNIRDIVVGRVSACSTAPVRLDPSAFSTSRLSSLIGSGLSSTCSRNTVSLFGHTPQPFFTTMSAADC